MFTGERASGNERPENGRAEGKTGERASGRNDRRTGEREERPENGRAEGTTTQQIRPELGRLRFNLHDYIEEDAGLP